MKKFFYLLFILSICLVACDDDKSSHSPGSPNNWTAVGGASDSGNGGAGGVIQIMAFADMSINRSGGVNASFSIPSISYDTGENGAVISGSTAVNVVTVEPSANVLYMVAGDTNLYRSDGNGVLADEDPLTGIEIARGAVVIFSLNSGGGTACELVFASDVVINGSLTTAYSGADRGPLSITTSVDGSIAVGSRGSVTTTGSEGDSLTNGGNGGAINFIAEGYLVVSGPLDSSGGSGSQGGNAGNIELVSLNRNIYVSADVTASGGNGISLSGGMANNISVICLHGNTGVSGDLTSRGGDSESANAGTGATVTVQAGGSSMGNCSITGMITTRGGESETLAGAPGGPVDLRAYGGFMKISGSVNSSGGTGGTTGGPGGAVSMNVYLGATRVTAVPMAPGDLIVGAPVNSSGGDGPTQGGDAGVIVCMINSYVDSCMPPSGELALYGTGFLSSAGGDGDTAGGTGGAIVIFANPSYYYGDEVEAGNIENNAAIITKGGDSESGAGGTANIIQMLSASHAHVGIVNRGALDCSGGDGQTTGGAGGGLIMRTALDIQNYGSLDASGGNGVSGAGGSGGMFQIDNFMVPPTPEGSVYNNGGVDVSGGSGISGGSSGTVIVTAPNDIENNGAIDAWGGDSTGAGGSGGVGAAAIMIYNTLLGTITNRGIINGWGGEATGSGGGGGAAGACQLFSTDRLFNYASIYLYGGNSNGGAASLGGTVLLRSGGIEFTWNSAPVISVVCGNGGTSADIGTIEIDFLDVTPADGTLP